MKKIRLQKIIADSGFCSRRKAEEFIQNGDVTVNGRPVKIGDGAIPGKDLVAVKGKAIYLDVKRTHKYIMLYKPRGYISTMSDEQGRRCVADLLTEIDARVFPIGRLDVNSEGLLLFTTDGQFANDLMHPAKHVSKTYRVTVTPDLTDEQAALLSAGIEVDGRMTAPSEVRILKKEKGRVVTEIVLREGRNRQIRKMCESLGINVIRLKRTAIGPLKLGMLKPGTHRDLTPQEIKAVRSAIAPKA